MEEKKLDINSIIGFVLIFGILLWMLYNNRPTPEELEAQEKAKQEQVEVEAKEEAAKDEFVTTPEDFVTEVAPDSTKLADLQTKIGAFAYSESLSEGKAFTEIENDVLALKVSNKGGYIAEVRLKQYVNHDSLPIYLIKDNNTFFNINFGTTDNRTLNTNQLYFQPTLTTSGDNQVLSMKLKVSETKYLEYRYELKPEDYMLGFTIRSQGLGATINSSQDVQLDWKL